MPLVVILIGALALTPTRYSGWVAEFSGPVVAVVAPLSLLVHRMTGSPAASRAVRERPENPEAVDTDQARLRIDYWTGRALSAEAEAAELRDRLQRLAPLLSHQGVSEFIPTPVDVIGTKRAGRGSLLLIRGGGFDGIREGDVVTLDDFQQLVGRVSEASPNTAEILPITHPAAGYLGAAVEVDPDQGEAGLVPANLKAAGEGLLEGELEYREPLPGSEPRQVEPGMLVRLRDERWPSHANLSTMLGRVVSVDAVPGTGGRLRISVETGRTDGGPVGLTKPGVVLVWRQASPETPDAGGRR